MRATRFDGDNLKVSEFLYRRVDIEDVVDAHLLAIERAPQIGFGRYIISATTPFTRDDLRELRHDAAAVVRRRVPDVRGRVRAPRLVDGADHRPRLRQRARARASSAGSRATTSPR